MRVLVYVLSGIWLCFRHNITLLNHNNIVMKRDENPGYALKDSKACAKIAINVLSALFTALLAGVLFILGLRYKALSFFIVHYDLFFWLVIALLSVFIVVYFIFYALRLQSFYRLIFCLFLFLDVVALLFFLLSATGIITKLNSIEAIREYIAGFGATAVLIFILFQFLQVIILPVPGSVSVGVGVALFGPLRCSVFSLIGILLGSIVAFFIGRVIGYKAVCWIVGKDDLDKWLKKMKGKDYLLLSLMFLLPLFPDDVLCFIAGLSSIGWLYFIIMITITRIISVFSTAYSLQLIPFTTWWGILIWIFLGAAVVLSFWYVCKYSDKIDSFLKRKFKLKGRRDGK